MEEENELEQVHSNPENKISTQVEHPNVEIAKVDTQLSFVTSLKIGFVKLVKLNYTSISSFSFHMLHCVTINGAQHLYLYGDQQCYLWWQYLIMFTALPIVLLFPLCFGFSLDLMKEKLISPNKFLIASVFPPYSFVLWMKKKWNGLAKCEASEDELLCVDVIMEMEEILFKSEDSFPRWPVVQLYRNLFIVTMSTFILNPVYLVIGFILVFLVFGIHDRQRMPYKNWYLNFLQRLSSGCLLAISACNIIPAFSFIMNLKAIPNMAVVVPALKYLEMALCGMVPLSLLVWKISNRYKQDAPYDRSRSMLSIASHRSGISSH